MKISPHGICEEVERVEGDRKFDRWTPILEGGETGHVEQTHGGTVPGVAIAADSDDPRRGGFNLILYYKDVAKIVVITQDMVLTEGFNCVFPEGSEKPKDEASPRMFIESEEKANAWRDGT